MTAPLDPPSGQPWDAAPLWDGSDPWAPPGNGASNVDRPAGTPVPGAVRRRPIMMAIAGLFAGLGLAFLLIHFAKIALGTNAPLVVVAIGVVVGVALAYTLPPRRSRRSR